MREKILVTGAAGFVGSNVVDALLERGEQVRGLVRRPEQAAALERRGVEVITGDVRDSEVLRRGMSEVAGVYHIAALFRRADPPDREYHEVNVEGTRRVFESAIAAGVPKIVYCSTIGVLGDVREIPASESTPYNPGDPYQVSKTKGEQCALEFFRDGRIRGTVIRPAMIYGPGDTRHLKLFRMIARRRFFYVGRGEALVHFIDVRDLAQAFLAAMEIDNANGEIFIIAGRRYMPLRDFARIVADQLGVPPPWLRLPVKPMQALGTLCEGLCKPFGVSPPLYRRRVDFFTKNRAFDTTRARKILGFEPKQDVDGEISDTLADYRARDWL